MQKAVENLWKDQVKIRVYYSLGESYYCELHGTANDAAAVQALRAEMQRLVEADLPIKKCSVKTEDAEQLFHDKGMKDKERLLHYRRSSRVNIYELVVQAGLHRAPSIKVAEAAKIIENTQRDVNIALMNELSIIFDRMGVNTFDVLKAAGTKWNFLPFSPGLVGGHCIGVDPYYLVHKAKELQYHTKMINSGRYVNDSMGRYIGKKVVKKIISQGKNILGAHVLVMGMTFKENVSDIRNSKVADIINEFKDFGAEVDVMDPFASPLEVLQEYGIRLVERPGKKYDAVVVAVAHTTYLKLDESYFMSITNEHAVLADVKGVYRGSIHQMIYWSL